MKNAVLTTERLVLREMCREDQAALNKMLQDPEVMYAYAHAFSDEEAEEWLERQLARYRQYGFGLWAVIIERDRRIDRPVRPYHAGMRGRTGAGGWISVL